MKRRGCDLPEEVLGEIFSWLPPESLFRFKCVSKLWYALINFLIKNPEFVNKHLGNIDNKLLSSMCLVFCCPSVAYYNSREPEYIRNKLFKLVTVYHNDNHSRNRNSVSIEDFVFPTLPRERDLAFFVRRHYNGIICLASFDKVTLCNPAIKEWRNLSKPCLDYFSIQERGLGFGYDFRADDYKIVRFGYDWSSPDEMGYINSRAEVYSMRRDSWREIGFRFTFKCLEICSPCVSKEVFCKGVFYWSVQSHNNCIISFDMFDEVFRSIQLPDSLLVVQEDHFIRIAVWNESVALFFYKKEKAVTNSIEVWVMDDCSSCVKVSCPWIKKLTIELPVEVGFPLAFLKNDDILMQAHNIGGVFLYNLHSQMHTNIPFVQGIYPKSNLKIKA